MKKLILQLTLLVVAWCWNATEVAAESRADREFVRAKEKYESQVAERGKPRTYRDRWEGVIARLEEFALRNPRHPRAAEAQYLAAMACTDMYRVSRLSADARVAVEAFDRLLENYPGDAKAAEGLWHAAQLLENPLNDLDEAYSRYSLLLARYPRTPHAPAAKTRLTVLQPTMDKAAPVKPASSAALLSASQGERATLNGIRFWSNPGYTRIVLDLSQSAEYSINFLPRDEKNDTPSRIYVDLTNVAPVGGLPESSIVNDGLLRQIRTGRPTNGSTRVVLDLNSITSHKLFALANPSRIVIDVMGTTAQNKTLAAARKNEGVAVGSTSPPLSAAPTTLPSTPAAIPTINAPETTSRPETVSVVKPQGEADQIGALLQVTPAEETLKIPVPTTLATSAVRKIVIDAGHGGKDPGAIGPSGLQEKDVTLSMALLLADEVNRRLGWEVILTRNDDTFIPLEERTAIANKVGADLFVSIHANASPNSKARGVETYYLNFSKNEKAAAVAARENGTSLRQVGDLELILFDLMAHSKIEESSRLATEIQSSVVEGLMQKFDQVKNLGVKQGPFYVLLGANMPSVLVEAAFISNTAEEKRLASRSFQERTVRAILDGIRSYAGNLKVIARQ